MAWTAVSARPRALAQDCPCAAVAYSALASRVQRERNAAPERSPEGLCHGTLIRVSLAVAGYRAHCTFFRVVSAA